MNYLFVHQHFPAQYVHLVRHLIGIPGNRVVFISQKCQHSIEGVENRVYQPQGTNGGGHPYVLPLDNAVRAALAVNEVCAALRAEGFVPDIIAGHAGWGETLLIHDVFPEVPLLCYFEFYFHAQGLDVGFDPEFSQAHADDNVRLHLRNAVSNMSFTNCHWMHTATEWQRSYFPSHMQARMTALHEGVDTSRVHADPQARLVLPNGVVLTAEDLVITFVARDLEPYRGFHHFMRALPKVMQANPDVHVVVVGGDGVSYGALPPYGGTYRNMLLAELSGKIDLQRIHFLGRVPRNIFLSVLQISSAHTYFSYPFVPSWSLFEAMAVGCLIVGSDNAPVSQILQHEETAYLVNTFDAEAVADTLLHAVNPSGQHGRIRDAARAHIVKHYDLHTRILPRWLQLLDDVMHRRWPSQNLSGHE